MNIKLNKNQSGIIHHLALFVLIGLVLAGVGFAGWRVWENKNNVNASYNWTYLTGVGSTFEMKACKIDLGANWHIKAQVKNKLNSYATWKIESVNKGVYSALLSGSLKPLQTTNVHINSRVPKSVKLIRGSFTPQQKISTTTYAYDLIQSPIKNCN